MAKASPTTITTAMIATILEVMEGAYRLIAERVVKTPFSLRSALLPSQ
jgi:hypothetical protein